MQHTLNKRRKNCYEISSPYEEERIPQKLHQEQHPQKDKLPSYADAWRNQDVTKKITRLE